MEHSYKVSCIIPVYNVAEYLEECVRSVLAQTLDSVEIILMDDGSTDSSPTIAKMLAEENENVFYYHKENGGLGQARNVAIPHAHGEYIIFLDSDDMVPKDAYEKMYRKAKENNVDMVIGGVRRFNSKGQWKSDIHARATKQAKDYTSILETPELIYDTTSWNKMIRREFYLENNFHFPEGILYEDIPVTIPMHHLAKGVCVLEDLVYLWRVREGGNKSITQDRTAIPNLMDRIAVMKMLDEFYEKNVSDERAIFEKNYKWLTLDLRLYIQQFANATEEYIDLAMEEIRGFLSKMDQGLLEKIPAIDRMKYELIGRNDREGILKLLDYEKNEFWMVKAKKKKVDGQTHFLMNSSYGDFEENFYDMTPDMQRAEVMQRINDIHWEGSKYIIDGFSVVKRMGNAFTGRMKLSAELLNLKTLEKAPIEIINVRAEGIRGSYGFGVNRRNFHFSYTSYLGNGHRIIIDFSKPEIQAVCGGDVKVLVHSELDGICKDFFIHTPRINEKKYVSPRCLPDYGLTNGVKVITDYSAGYHLILHTEKDLHEVEEVLFLEDGLELSITGQEEKYHATYPKEGENGRVYPELDQNLFSSKSLKIAQYHENNSGFNKIACDDKGLVYLENKKIGPKLQSLQKQGKRLIFTVDLSAYTGKENIQEEPKLFFKSKSKELLSSDISMRKVAEGSYQAVLDLGNKQIAQEFCKNFWMAYLRLGQEEVAVYGDCGKKPERFSVDLYYYQFPKEEILTLQTGVKWHWFENTWRRRLVMEKIAYPILRKLLPVHKKRMVFESYWGGKYDCNPKGFYEYMQEKHPDYTCIWSFADERTRMPGNAIRVRRNSLKYHYYMATSKYFMDNVNFAGSFKKKKGQVVFQTMHGTPMKTLGLDVPGDFATEKGRNDFIARCKRWDYLIVQSDRVAEITKSCFAFTGTHLRTGYPRNDKVFAGNTPENIKRLKEKMGLPLDKKLILYAPTWRIKNQFHMNMDIERLKREVGEDCVIMLRIHPFSAPGLDPSLLDEFIVNMTSYPGIEELYLVSNLVITDYSSVMFDFAVLNKPMFFYTYDLEDYRDKLRGFYFDFDKEVPGPILHNFEELLDALKNMDEVNAKYNDKLQEFRKSFCEYEDGSACERVFKAAFH